MKKLLLLSACMFASILLRSSHIVGGEIQITHLQNHDYLLELKLFEDLNGVIHMLPDQQVSALTRDSLLITDTWILPIQRTDTIFPSVLGCNNTPLPYMLSVYSDTITLDTIIYSEPAGYLFQWLSCCRVPGITNIINSSSHGATIVTFFSTVHPTTGQYLYNSTPNLNNPISDILCLGQPYMLNFGGSDPDGDLLQFGIMNPIQGAYAALPGNVTPLYAPYTDPKSLYTSVSWMQCYNRTNQINGFSDQTCNSLYEPDRLLVLQQTGSIYGTPGGPAPGKYLVGLTCVEKRNGVVISEVMRDFPIRMIQCNNPPNTPPVVHTPQIQSLGSWNGDTLVFTGSPVCVQLDVTDQDSFSTINLEAVYSDYDANDLSFIQDQALINPGDTFRTALCFNPDSFVAQVTKTSVIARNAGCYDPVSDTLDFYFQFTGYSNAGWGGDKTIPMTSFTGSIPLFPMLSRNPYSGGTWYDLDGNNHMNPNGFLEWKYVTQPKTYRFIYVQKEPNYPPDTAFLTLNFIYPSSLDNLRKDEIALYPNPSHGAFTLVASEHLVGQKIEVFSYDLKKIKEFRIQQGNNQYSIDQEGLYFIRIGEEGKVRKLIIQN